MEFKKFAKKISSFFKEAFLELKKVKWLSRKETIEYTLVVIFITLVVAIFLGSLDYLFYKAIRYFILKY